MTGTDDQTQAPALPASADRFDALMKRLKPEYRIKELEAERDKLQERFMQELGQARIQDRLVAEAEAGQDEDRDQLIQVGGREVSAHAQEQADLETSRYYQRAQWRTVAAIADELEAVLNDLEGAADVGTRAERRRGARRSPA